MTCLCTDMCVDMGIDMSTDMHIFDGSSGDDLLGEISLTISQLLAMVEDERENSGEAGYCNPV